MTRLYGDAARAELRRYADARLGKWAYSNRWNNVTNLDAKDEADCSDWTDALYTHLGYPLPGMSYQQATQGQAVYTWHGERGAAPAAFARLITQGKLAGGELVCMGLDPSRPGQITHTEAYDHDLYSYGHGGPGPGPIRHRIDQAALLGYADTFTIRRIIQDPPKGILMALSESDQQLILDKTIKTNNAAGRTETLLADLAAKLDAIDATLQLILDKTIKTNNAAGRTENSFQPTVLDALEVSTK